MDIPESLTQVLCRYIEVRDGHLFTTAAGRLLDQRNVLDVLHQAGKRGGFHVFRRFRFAVLRKAGVPDDLIKTVAGPFARLDGPLRGAITARREVSSGMVREPAGDAGWANWATNWGLQFARTGCANLSRDGF